MVPIFFVGGPESAAQAEAQTSVHAAAAATETPATPAAVSCTEGTFPNDGELQSPPQDADVWPTAVSGIPPHLAEVHFCASERFRQLIAREFCSLTCHCKKYLGVRSILVGFLLQLSREFLLPRMTCSQAVYYLDRVINRNPLLSKSKYQVLSLACVLVAAKFEEPDGHGLSPAALAGCISRTTEERTANADLIIQLEGFVLKTIDWQARVASVALFLSTIGPVILLDSPEDALCGRVASPSEKKLLTKTLTKLADRVLLDADLLWGHRSSKLAAACIYHARRSITVLGWSTALESASGYDVSDFQAALEGVQACCADILTPFQKKIRHSSDSMASPDSVVFGH